MSGGAAIGPLAKALIEGLVSTASDGRRLTRGRTYVRDGAVVELEVEPGVIKGRVLGSEPTPYNVRLHVPPSAWAMSGADIHEMDIAGLKRLIPDYYRVRWTCTCPDGAEACKHAVAVALTFAQRLEIEPELLMRWRSSSDGASAPAEDQRAERRGPFSVLQGGGDPDDGARVARSGSGLRLVTDTGVEPEPAVPPDPDPLTAQMVTFLALDAVIPPLVTGFEPLALARPVVGSVDLGEYVLDAHLMIRAALRAL